jgi:hypothetical protein
VLLQKVPFENFYWPVELRGKMLAKSSTTPSQQGAYMFQMAVIAYMHTPSPDDCGTTMTFIALQFN